MGGMGFIPKHDSGIREKKMKLFKILYFSCAVLGAVHYSEKNDITKTMLYCTHMIVAVIYIVNP